MIEFLNKQSALIILGIGFALGAAYYFTSVEETLRRSEMIHKKIEQQIFKQQGEVDAAKAVAKNREKFEDELNFVSDRLKAALEYLPIDLNAQDILGKLNSEAQAAGVKLISIRPGATRSEKFYEEVSVDVELEGGFSQLTLFLSYISKIKRIVRIRSYELKPKDIIDGIPILRLKGVLVAYRYIESKEEGVKK